MLQHLYLASFLLYYCSQMSGQSMFQMELSNTFLSPLQIGFLDDSCH